MQEKCQDGLNSKKGKMDKLKQMGLGIWKVWKGIYVSLKDSDETRLFCLRIRANMDK